MREAVIVACFKVVERASLAQGLTSAQSHAMLHNSHLVDIF
jgi:hypothetical protein